MGVPSSLVVEAEGGAEEEPACLVVEDHASLVLSVPLRDAIQRENETGHQNDQTAPEPPLRLRSGSDFPSFSSPSVKLLQPNLHLYDTLLEGYLVSVGCEEQTQVASLAEAALQVRLR